MKKKVTKKTKSRKVKKQTKKKQRRSSGKRPIVTKTKKGAGDLGKPIGKVTHYYGKIKVGIIKLLTTVSVGQTLYFKGATADFKQKIS